VGVLVRPVVVLPRTSLVRDIADGQRVVEIGDLLRVQESRLVLARQLLRVPDLTATATDRTKWTLARTPPAAKVAIALAWSSTVTGY
jgi:hypothetical protein